MQTAHLSAQVGGQINWAVQGTRSDMAFELIDRSAKLREGKIRL